MSDPMKKLFGYPMAVFSLAFLAFILLALVSTPTTAGARDGDTLPDTGFTEVEDPYPAPTDVHASDGTFMDRVKVLWESLVIADYYEIFRAASETGTKTLIGSTSDLIFDDLNVDAETVYYYWVRACSLVDCSELSVFDTGWRQRNIPPIPSNVQASDGTYSDRIQVSWDESGPATYYEIYRAESEGGTKTLIRTVSESPYDDREVAFETPYFYWVLACGVDGCSEMSAYDSGWRALPAVPANLQASDGTYIERVSVTWDASFGANFYELYRAESPTGDKTLIAKVTSSHFDDVLAEYETVYYYWVKGCVIDGCSAFSDFDTGYRSLPAVPQNLQASDGTYLDKIEVTWDSVSGADFYELYRSDTQAGSKELVITTNEQTYDDTAVAVEQVYYYWVKACVTDACSDFSAFDTGYRSLPAAPLNLAASDGTYLDKVRVTWNSSTGAEYYKLFQAETPTGTRTLIATQGSTLYDDMDVLEVQEYYYWVQACNAEGCSVDSTMDSGWRAAEQPTFYIYSPFVLSLAGTNPDR